MIDFHDPENRLSYSGRQIDPYWTQVMNDMTSLEEVVEAADIGCGGGLYTSELSEAGAGKVTGVDSSSAILQEAERVYGHSGRLVFQTGDAAGTGLCAHTYDLVLQRALIHHIHDLQPVFEEAGRILKEDGVLIIQDRTPEDCFIKGSPSHIRGCIFDLFPKLRESEERRRRTGEKMAQELSKAGFKLIEVWTFWEVRRYHTPKQSVLQDIRERKGRSLLHQLTDQEIEQLINYMADMLHGEEYVTDQDRWTIWKAVKHVKT